MLLSTETSAGGSKPALSYGKIMAGNPGTVSDALPKAFAEVPPPTNCGTVGTP